MTLKSLIRPFIPALVFRAYHFALAASAAIFYGNPSSKMIVIGVTGTNGKSSTVQFISQLLDYLGYKNGYTTTAGFSIAGQQIENRMKMTMPGRFYLQRLLSDMQKAGCAYALVETSSQGLDQYRHLGVNYDAALFTNLTPEHIEAHGGFDAYKRAKGKLFAHLTQLPEKVIDSKEIPKTILVNDDDPHADYFASFPSDRTIRFGWNSAESSRDRLVAHYHVNTASHTTFEVNGVPMQTSLRAAYQHKNILAAIAAVYAYDIPLTEIAEAVEKLQPIPGRFESVDLGQPFHVIVDYAYEPYALEALYEAAKILKPKRVIGVHGSAGGGRDIARRVEIGKLAGEKEEIVFVTNEDPYDEDPRQIIEQVAEGAKLVGKVESKDLRLVTDRAEAIAQAIGEAQEGDLVLITGKGSEPVMAVANGKKIPWSDLQEAKNALHSLGYGA
ncbi:MAG: UDP-N-acetylmuramyl-tripeptide synthetase [Patescibacteria group bacterium]|jgi:UDP-N-acetylmuramoyl-L-alanyl-D-glutamate--2,6-diaminopimelate ligase